MILGYDFCDKHIEPIHPHSRLDELGVSAAVPIVIRPSARPQDASALPVDQEYFEPTKRVSPNGHVVNRPTLPAESQPWAQVSTKRERLVLGTRTRQSYDQHLCLAGTGIAQVKSNEQFRIMVPTSERDPKYCCRTKR